VCPVLRNLPKLAGTTFLARYVAIAITHRSASPENEHWTEVSLTIDTSEPA